MKFYFDVTEHTTKTIAIEAENLEQALKRVESAYDRKEFTINREAPDDVEFKYVQEEVENLIEEGLVAEEEFETFDCNHVSYNEEEDYYECPVCKKYIADRAQIKDDDYELPKFCQKCGTKLRYSFFIPIGVKREEE